MLGLASLLDNSADNKLGFQRLDHTKSPLGDGEVIHVSYNPGELSFSKAANYADINIPGLDAPVLQFVRGSTETLALELFFDSTKNGTGVNADAVTAEVDRFYRMVKIVGELHTPPIVRVSWGKDFPGFRNDQSSAPIPAFDGIVTTCSRKFTLFNPDGVPLRAVVNLSLQSIIGIPR